MPHVKGSCGLTVKYRPIYDQDRSYVTTHHGKFIKSCMRLRNISTLLHCSPSDRIHPRIHSMPHKSAIPVRFFSIPHRVPPIFYNGGRCAFCSYTLGNVIFTSSHLKWFLYLFCGYIGSTKGGSIYSCSCPCSLTASSIRVPALLSASFLRSPKFATEGGGTTLCLVWFISSVLVSSSTNVTLLFGFSTGAGSQTADLLFANVA